LPVVSVAICLKESNSEARADKTAKVLWRKIHIDNPLVKTNECNAPMFGYKPEMKECGVHEYSLKIK
jgi:hypothetical protein